MENELIKIFDADSYALQNYFVFKRIPDSGWYH